MKMRSVSILSAAALACTAATAPADITYTDLFTLGKPAGYIFAGPYPSDSVHLAANGQVVGYGIDANNHSHALLWNAANPNGLVLEPANSDSRAFGTNGTQQVGTNISGQAILWSGTPSSGVTLNTTNYFPAEALDVRNGQVVGQGTLRNGNTPHALLWTSANSAPIDLNPTGYFASIAIGTDGSNQAGYVDIGSEVHAALWTGSAESFVDLNPAGFDRSAATATRNGQQVGSAAIGPPNTFAHAMLWNGSAASAVDLNPAGFDNSGALDTDGIHQVGAASRYPISLPPNDPEPSEAILWNGSADDYVDLGALLPSNFVTSGAISIEGDQVYGLATDTDGNTHAIVWSVPEPASLALVGLAALTLRRRPGRRSGR